MTPAGLEPAIPGSVGRCLIHWATGPDACTVHAMLNIKCKIVWGYLGPWGDLGVTLGSRCGVAFQPMEATADLQTR